MPEMHLEVAEGESLTLIAKGRKKKQSLAVANIGEKLYFREEDGAVLSIVAENGAKASEVAARLTNTPFPKFRTGPIRYLSQSWDAVVFVPSSILRACVYVTVRKGRFELTGGGSIIGGIQCANLMRKIST